jgi:hypothetical protein
MRAIIFVPAIVAITGCLGQSTEQCPVQSFHQCRDCDIPRMSTHIKGQGSCFTSSCVPWVLWMETPPEGPELVSTKAAFTINGSSERITLAHPSGFPSSEYTIPAGCADTLDIGIVPPNPPTPVEILRYDWRGVHLETELKW